MVIIGRNSIKKLYTAIVTIKVKVTFRYEQFLNNFVFSNGFQLIPYENVIEILRNF